MLTGCDVGRVLQAAGVQTPSLQRVQDAVSVVPVSAGGQQTLGVADQNGLVLGEEGCSMRGPAATRAAWRTSALS